MNKLIGQIEKCKPYFEKLSMNPYLRGIRDGFISLIPVILFSSIFMLVAYVPNIFGYYWSAGVEANLLKAYNLSMGVLALFMSATIARSLGAAFNVKLPKTRQMNLTSVMVAAMSSFLLLSVEFVDGNITMGFMGTKGLLTSFVVGFIVPNFYKFCVGRNITIKMPKEVPNNISQTFADLIPMSLSITFFWVFDMAFRAATDIGFSQWIIELFQPLFSAADGYVGLSFIFGAMAFFWFVGIHGPSIVEPAVSAIYIANVAANLEMYQAGEHATNVLSQGAQYFVATLGGTGATLVITLMFAFMCKSKQLKAIGRSSAVPVMFGVNEPVLFGAPIVLNPVFFVPFILAPIVNVCLLKFFIDMGMNGFIYNLPWTTPGPLGLVLGTGFAGLSFVLAAVLLVVDFIIYYPFMKVYDKQCLEDEAKRTEEEGKEKAAVKKEEKQPQVEKQVAVPVGVKNNEKVSVLVVCANGATSSMLANAIAKGGKEAGMDLESTAMAYGQHRDLIGDFDLIILAPQMDYMFDDLKKDCEGTKTIAATTNGPQYVSLARDSKEALTFALGLIKKARVEVGA